MAVNKAKFKLSRMAGYTLVAALVYLVGRLTVTFFPGSILGLLKDLGLVALLVPIAYYSVIGLKLLKNNLLWKVRNRIIVSYLFVGIFPVTILVLISFFVLLLILRSLSGFYLELQLDAIAEELDRFGQRVELDYYRRSPSILEMEPLLRTSSQESLRRLPPGLKHATVHIYRLSPTVGGSEEFRLLETILPDSLNEASDSPQVAPPWLEDGFADLIARGNDVVFGNVFDLAHEYKLVVHLPFNDKTIDYIKRRTSIDLIASRSNPEENSTEFELARASLTEREDPFSVSWFYFFTPIVQDTGRTDDVTWSILLSVPVWIVLENFVATGAELIVLIIVLLVLTFLVVEFASLLIGVAIAHSITSSIHNIYTGAQNIMKGHFGFRIPSRKKDQLDSMADSFNEMSMSILKLMDQVSEREWMEKELEIAKEVQRQLFPQQLPDLQMLQISASCTPARQVSGDYYDFLTHDSNHVDIVVGDISGKGISAALLMASLQSSIRSGLQDSNFDVDQSLRMSGVVTKVNRQLYRRSSPESYSTLVINHFDAETKTLSYCNAGHHPPLVFSNGSVSSLVVGGTVVGLFENWEYEGGSAQLEPGDLVVYFTDGVVEAENEEGEQFGTDRVIEFVQSNTFLTADDIQALILDQVLEWSAGLEQADDITVLCVKYLG